MSKIVRIGAGGALLALLIGAVLLRTRRETPQAVEAGPPQVNFTQPGPSVSFGAPGAAPSERATAPGAPVPGSQDVEPPPVGEATPPMPPPPPEDASTS